MISLLGKIPDGAYFTAVLAILLAWELAPLAREQKPRPNPDALATYRAIIELCERDPQAVPGRACSNVMAVVDFCRTNGRTPCTMDRFHESMARQGFILPPQRLPVMSTAIGSTDGN